MSAVTPAVRDIDFHGIRLRVTCPLPRVQNAIDDLFAEFAVPDAPGAEINIDVAAIADPEIAGDRLPPAASLLYSNRLRSAESSRVLGLEFDVFRTPEAVFVDLGPKGMMIFDLNASRAEILLADDASIHVDILGSLLVYTLSELVKPRDMRLVHAAAVAIDGRVVIIPGTQGRGKTTTCLSLVADGFGFLSDDVIFLRNCADLIEVCALPEHVSVTEKTIGMFPELRERAGRLTQGLLKQHVRMDDLFPGRIVMSGSPAIILFPEVTGETSSHLEPIARPRALELLLPRGISVLDRADSARNFQMLSRLVAQCACYRLAFGTRVGDVAPLVADALAKTP